MADNSLSSIREQLDNLNDATDDINTLEIRLDTVKKRFRETQAIFNKELGGISRKQSKHIAKSRLFFDLKTKENELKKSAQNAAENYKRKQIIYELSKKQLAELLESKDRSEYSDCRNTSNVQPTQKKQKPSKDAIKQQIELIHDSENECNEAERIHEEKVGDLLQTESCLRKISQEFGSSIKKSKNYYERKEYLMKILKSQIELVTFLEDEIQRRKDSYSTSMKNLEIISEQIHFERSMNKEYNLENR